MTFTPQIRLIALIALLAVAGLVASTQLVFRGMLSSSDSEPAVAPASISGGAEKAEAAAKQKTAARTQATKSAAKAGQKSTAATATNAKAPAKLALRTRGLPGALTRALQSHRVVVVSLFTPNASVDRISRAEAKAGAEAAGVGFVALDVLERKNAEPLGTKLGVVKAPSVLVYTRPAKLFVKLDGFADMAMVAQAAENARR